MPYSLLNSKNLMNGISVWKTKKAHWDSDFHNELYREIYEFKEKGFDKEFLIFLIDKLALWKATRGSSKSDLLKRGLEKLDSLSYYSNSLIAKYPNVFSDISMYSWNEVEPLFKSAMYIKKTISKSPVFASKLCHFILPNIFMVTDNKVIGAASNPDEYQNYWEYCRQGWAMCNNKNELIAILENEIEQKVFFKYPFLTKIIELCIIGSSN